MNSHPEKTVRLWPPAAMLEIEATLNPDSHCDRDLALRAARRLDRQLARIRPIIRWANWLDGLRRVPVGTSQRGVDAEGVGPAGPDSEDRLSNDPKTPSGVQEREFVMAPADVVRTVCRSGAEKAFGERGVSADALHKLVLDPEALLFLVNSEAIRYLTGEDPSRGDVTPPLVAQQVPKREEDGNKDTATDLAKSESQAAQQDLRWRVADALFPLLNEIGVEIDSQQQAAKGTQLLCEWIGDEALDRFRGIDRWLNELRGRDPGDRLQQLVQEVEPALLARTETGDFHRLSYRLFLRERLKRFCEREGWQPNPEKLAALTRQRIGKVLNDVAADFGKLSDQQRQEVEKEGFRAQNVTEAQKLIAPR